MKKILAMILTLCLLCGAIALAEGNVTTFDQNSTSGGTTTLEFSVSYNDNYTITIPTKVVLDANGNAEFDVKITPDPGYNVSSDIIVGVSKAEGTLSSTQADGTETSIPYVIEVADPVAQSWVPIDTDEVLRMDASNPQEATQTLSIRAKVGSAPEITGTYTDTITFTAQKAALK